MVNERSVEQIKAYDEILGKLGISTYAEKSYAYLSLYFLDGDAEAFMAYRAAACAKVHGNGDVEGGATLALILIDRFPDFPDLVRKMRAESPP